MRSPLRSLIFFSLLAGFLSGCNRQPQATQAAQREKHFKTHFQDESQFIVETVLTDLAEMAAYAKGNRLPTELSVTAEERSDSEFRTPSYDVKIVFGKNGVVTKPLRVSQPIWSPALYEDFAKTLAGGAPVVTNKHDPNDLAVLLALTDLQPATIESENERSSRLLQTNFTDPTLHEMAAVILGAFALRESSGNFYDVRLPLCRMTAHLALARALSAGADGGVNGRAAGVILFTLMNNQKTALEKLKALAGEPKLQPWVNALRVRNTYDYRELERLDDPSPVESITHYFAISRCINADAGWEKLPDGLKTEGSDFCRIAQAEASSVGLGHELTRLALPLEFAEIGQVYSLATGKTLSEKEMIKFLNQPPENCFTAAGDRVRIIGPGQWAFFLQRHLCHALQYHGNFLQRKLGVPDAAREFVAESDRRFGGLRLYPFVRRFNCTTEAEYHQAVDAGMPVTVATPHLVSPDIWNYICSPPNFAERYNPFPNPHVNEWHKHNPPPGTAYNPKPRMYHPSLVNRPDAAAVLGRLHDLAPYDGTISYWLLKVSHHEQESYAQADEVYRPLLEYATGQNWQLAKYVTNDPPRYEQVMLRYAKLNPSGYFSLGRYFADRQEEEKAAGYYEKAVELDTDAVTMASYCEWLVNYYHRKGRLAEAEKLADRAAEVYSMAGLRTKARLMETLEKYDEAREYYSRIEERYEQAGPLVGFYVRYKAKTGNARFDPEVQKRLKTLFPRGIEKVGLPDFKAPPEQGVLIAEENELVQQAGLKKGDLILALDGIRVYDMTQYQYVRELTNAPQLTLLVWNGSEYSEKKASPPKRRFGAQFNDYYQPAKK